MTQRHLDLEGQAIRRAALIEASTNLTRKSGSNTTTSNSPVSGSTKPDLVEELTGPKAIRCPDCGRVRGPKHMEVCAGPKKSGSPDSGVFSAANGLDRRGPEEEQPLLEVAQAIADEHPFVDRDAIRVARAYLDTVMPPREAA